MDVLFTVDHSSSTPDERSALERGFSGFAQALYAWGIDYRIMAVTMLDGCVVTSDLWIDDSYAESAAQGLIEAMIAQEPTGGDAESSQGLLRAKNAFSDSAQDAGGCNEGFRRQEAMLHIIGLSDEADDSPGGFQQYIDALALATDWPTETVFHGIGVPDGGSCGGDYTGFIEAAEQTGGSWVSVCDASWETQLDVLGQDLVARADRTSYQLEAQPDETSLQVHVASQLLSSGLWTYDAGTNAVTIGTSAEPELGASVSIDYSVEPDCE